MKKQLLLSAMALLLLSACGNNENEVPYVKSAFNLGKVQEQHPLAQSIRRASDIKESTFNKEGTKTILSKEDFLYAIAANSDFLDNSDSLYNDLELEDCKVKLSKDKFSFSSRQDSLTFYTIQAPLIDFSSCFKEDRKVVQTSLYLDNVSFDSQEYSITTVAELFNNKNKDHIVSQRVKEYDVAYFYDKTNTEGYTALFYRMQSNIDDYNKPCTKINNILSCKKNVKSIYLLDNELLVVHNNEFIEEVESQNGLYYASGTIRFNMDDWSATMTYNGVDVPPTYSATNGEEVIEGVLNPNLQAF